MMLSKLFLKKVYLKISASIINLFAKDNNHDIENTILIIGSTRSGTTYLMENINADNDYRLIFEPFNNTYIPEWKDKSTRHHIDPANPIEKDKVAVHKILTGQIRNKWTDQYNRKIRSQKRLIKAVRANLMVEFIRSKYPNLHIIYLIRDPYEVVASRINMNFDPKDLSRLLDQNHFLKQHYSDINIETLLQKTKTDEAKHTALWCLENRYLQQLEKDLNLNIIQYNDIKGMSVKYNNGNISLTEKQSRPSASSSTKGKYKLSQMQRDNIAHVLELFGML